jgi:hypothetical protein
VLDRLPVYPSRIVAAAGGGFWLTAFAARTQLVEFVLRENAYRRRMMKEIAPSTGSRRGCARAKLSRTHAGRPSAHDGRAQAVGAARSYGLVIRLSPQGTPLYSLHSRVDGVNHGIVAAARVRGLPLLWPRARAGSRLAWPASSRSLQRMTTPSSSCAGDKAVRRRSAIEGVDFDLAQARSMPGRRERRRQVDLTKVMAGVGRADVRARC